MAQLESLMRRNFLEYSSYFVLDRAIPDLRDGLKPVQRRILHTLFNMHDGRYHKVANVIGETMKLHPHGDASIGDALVVLANKGFFIDRQGNFGNLVTGHPAAAARYIECRLTPLALETLFFKPLTEFVPSYDGRTEEPVFLPAKLPIVLMLGTEGIAVGMATKILPHNLLELWRAQIGLLKGKKAELFPDFPQGGVMDVDEYDDGRGKVVVRARIEVRDPKHVVIREIPYGTTTESVIASIEAAVQKGRVKVGSISDFTTDTVEIELTLPRGVAAREVLPQLYAYTDCSVSVSSNLTLIRDRKPVIMRVSEVIEVLTERLRGQLRSELEYERGQLIDRQHWLTLEQIFVEKRVYKRIEKAKTEQAVRDQGMSGMAQYEKLFVRPRVDDDVKRLLEIRIRRISAYDIAKSRKEVEEIVRAIKAIDTRLRNMKRTTIRYIEELIEKYGDQFPRRTQIKRIKLVDKKAVARAHIKLGYDAKSGFFGSAVRGGDKQLSVSEYDFVLAISSDGVYRVMTPPEKVLLGGKLLYCEVFDPKVGVGFTVVYRDGKKIGYAKRIRIEKFIRNREYRLVKDQGGRLDLLLPEDERGRLLVNFVPAKRQRVKSAHFDLSTLTLTSPTARGARLAAKPISKFRLEAATPKPQAKTGRKAASKPSPKKRSAKKAAKKATPRAGKRAAPKIDPDGQGRLL